LLPFTAFLSPLGHNDAFIVTIRGFSFSSRAQ
jgi:hypothetical protein